MVPKNFKFYEVEEAFYEWDGNRMKITYVIQVKDSSLKPLYKITREVFTYRKNLSELYE